MIFQQPDIHQLLHQEREEHKHQHNPDDALLDQQ